MTRTVDAKEGLVEAARRIQDGLLVAFPTETVYGLGANALDEKAVKSVFVAKGRPSDNPLIVHVSAVAMAERVAVVDKKARALMQAFWPGPLTLVLSRKDVVPDVVTAGLDTVAVRMPDHPATLALINEADTPIVGPSANMSGHPSPTSAAHVADDFADKDVLVIEGGATVVGVESTVFDPATNTILRPGGVTKELLEETLKTPVSYAQNTPDHPKSPGVKHKHYTPQARVVIVEEKPALEENERYLSFDSPADAAKRLYAELRCADADNITTLYVQTVEETGVGAAVMDRLRRASENENTHR